MLFTWDEWENDETVYAKSILRPQFKTVCIAMLFMAGYGVAIYFGAPLAVLAILNGLFIGSFVLLTGIGYGILNDLFACRNNLEYFRFGHQPGQDRGLLKKTLDPNAHAFAWGFVATFPLALIAGILFGIAAFGAFLAGAPFAPFMIAILSIGAVSCAAMAHLFSKHKMRHRKKSPTYKQDMLKWETRILHISAAEYREFFVGMDGDQKAEFINAWLGNNDRNMFGYASLPLLAVGMLISTITVSALHISIAALALSLPLQIALGGAPAVLMLIGFAYFYYRMHKVKSEIKQPRKEPKVSAGQVRETSVELHNRPGMSPISSPQVGMGVGRDRELHEGGRVDRQSARMPQAPGPVEADDVGHGSVPEEEVGGQGDEKDERRPGVGGKNMFAKGAKNPPAEDDPSDQHSPDQ